MSTVGNKPELIGRLRDTNIKSGKSTSQNGSTEITVSSMRLQAAAKMAALVKMQEFLKIRQELDAMEFKLRQQKEELEI